MLRKLLRHLIKLKIDCESFNFCVCQLKFSFTFLLALHWISEQISNSRKIYDETIGWCGILWSSFIVGGEGFLAGETIASVDAFDGVSDVVEAEGDELGLGKRTPSKEIPLTSSFTTNCGSPVEEFSVENNVCSNFSF